MTRPKRSSLLERYSGLYKLVPGEMSTQSWHNCFYCGEPADQRDHVPPLARVEDYRATDARRKSYWLVRSCADCNRRLGDSLQVDLLDRVEHLKSLLQRVRKTHHTTAYWSDEELAELGGTLKSRIVSGLKTFAHLTARIEYYGGVKTFLEAYPDEY